jgi:multidrug transporter EmrE-like cation transporter
MNAIQEWAKKSDADELILFAILIAFVETIAQNTIKTSKHNSFQYIYGILLYTLVGYLLHKAYFIFPISRINVIWSCMSIIIAILLGYFVYDENMNTWLFLSIVFAILAIVCSFISL